MSEFLEISKQVLLRVPSMPLSYYKKNAKAAQSKDGFPVLPEISPEVCMAISIASSDLWESVLRYDTLSPKKKQKTHKSIMKYLNRMATRPTPFGLFAGVCAISTGAGESKVEFDPVLPNGKINAFCDFSLGKDLARTRLNDLLESFSPDLRWNGTSQFAGERVYGPRVDPFGIEEPRRKSVRYTKVLGAIKSILCDHKADYLELVRMVREKYPEVQIETVKGYISGLIENGYILAAPMPGDDTHSRFYFPMKNSALTLSESKLVIGNSLDNFSEAINLSNFASKVNDKCTSELATILSGEESFTKCRKIAFTLAAKCNDAQIGTSVNESLYQSVELLCLLAPKSSTDAWAQYNQAFSEYYGVDAVVPLQELIRPNSPVPLPGHLRGPAEDFVPASRESLPEPTPARRVKRQLVVESLKNGMHEVKLEPRHIEYLRAESQNFEFPASTDVYTSVTAVSSGEIDAGNFILELTPGLVAPGGRTAGRFKRDIGWCARTLPNTENDIEIIDCIYDANSTESWNVSNVPPRTERALCSGTSGESVEPSRRVSPSQLALVSRGERLHIIDTETAREVVVTQPHMLNYQHAETEVSFVLSLSEYNYFYCPPFSWEELGNIPFTPALSSGSVRLYPAQWKISAVALSGNLQTEKQTWEFKEFTELFKKYSTQWNVPRYVHCVLYDNRLPLDLDTGPSLRVLYDEYMRAVSQDPNATLTLHEWSGCDTKSWVKDSKGEIYANEFVFTVMSRSLKSTLSKDFMERQSTNIVPRDMRTKSLSDRWVSLQISSDSHSIVQVLENYLAPHVDSLKARSLVKNWHFVRYAEQSEQLRLRFEASDEELLAQLMMRTSGFTRELERAGLVRETRLVPYVMEVERYGGIDYVDSSQRTFTLSSELSLLNMAHYPRMALQEEVKGVFTIFQFLSCFGLENELMGQKVETSSLNPEVRQKYRELRNQIGNILQGQHEVLGDLASVTREYGTILDLQDVYGKAGRGSKGSLLLGIPVRSLLHLHFNRSHGLSNDLEMTCMGMLALEKRSIWEKGRRLAK